MFCGSRTARASVSAVARGGRDRTGPGGPRRAEPCPRGGGPVPREARPLLPTRRSVPSAGTGGTAERARLGHGGEGAAARGKTRVETKWRRASAVQNGGGREGGGGGRRCVGKAGRGRGASRMRAGPGEVGAGPGGPTGVRRDPTRPRVLPRPSKMLLPCSMS